MHGAAEDQGGEPTLAKIRKRFGDDVATIVADCTDAWVGPKPDFWPRKEAYLKSATEKTSNVLVGFVGR